MIPKRKSWLRNPALWFLLPAVLVFLILGIYPTVRALWTSLLNYNLTNPLGKKFVGLWNYYHMLTDTRFWHALGRSLAFVAASVTVSFVIGFAIALLLSKIHRFQTFYQVMFLLPMVISPTVAAYNFKFMYNYNFGIFNHMLEWIGLPRVDFLGNPGASLWATVVIDVWQWTPLAILILLAGIETLPKEIYEAAAIDGAGRFRTFASITVPLLRPFIAIVILIRLMDSMKSYEIIQLVTAGGPGTSSETLNTYLAKVSFEFFDIGYGSALGLVALNLTALISMALVKYTNIFRTDVTVQR